MFTKLLPVEELNGHFGESGFEARTDRTKSARDVNKFSKMMKPSTFGSIARTPSNPAAMKDVVEQFQLAMDDINVSKGVARKPAMGFHTTSAVRALTVHMCQRAWCALSGAFREVLRPPALIAVGGIGFHTSRRILQNPP